MGNEADEKGRKGKTWGWVRELHKFDKFDKIIKRSDQVSKGRASV